MLAAGAIDFAEWKDLEAKQANCLEADCSDLEAASNLAQLFHQGNSKEFLINF